MSRPGGSARRLRRGLAIAGSGAIGAAVLLWSLLPIYNMFLIALDPEEGEIEFDGNIVPWHPSLDSFADALSQEARYLEHFWQQFGNSIVIGLATMALTVLIGSLAAFAVYRMRFGRASWLTNSALATYLLPSSFLLSPIFRIVHGYGLADSLWSAVAAQVAFATPFAILLLQQYAHLVPIELDEAARLDGASAAQLYARIYVPLMGPALAAVAIYALVLAWDDYVFQFVLLDSTRNLTVSIVQAQLFVDTDAEWNAMMAAAIVYALPPILLFFGLAGYVGKGLRQAGSYA